MSQVSVPVRILALVGLLSALAVGAWTMTAGRNGTPGSAHASSVAPLPAVHRATTVAAAVNAHEKATAAAKDTTAAPAARKAPAKQAAPASRATKPVVRPAAQPPSQFPHTIAGQLKTHHVVVVLLYDPKAKVDSYSLAEAQLGAKNVDAGFLRVDVLDAHQAAPFTKAYGVLQDPTLLFFKRPGTLAFKLPGFADHDTVAQAAKNAALGLTSVEPS